MLHDKDISKFCSNLSPCPSLLTKFSCRFLHLDHQDNNLSNVGKTFLIPPLYKHICTCVVIDEDPFEKLVKEKWLGIRAEYQDHLMCDTEDGQTQHLAEAKKLFMNLLEESLKRYENDPLNTEKGQLISKEIFGDMSFCQKNIILPKKYHFAKKISFCHFKLIWKVLRYI